MPIRVLQVINSLSGGGAEHLLFDMHQVLASRANKVRIEYCTVLEMGELGRRLKEQGALVYDLGCRKYQAIKAVARLRSLLAGRSYDIVHAHLFPTIMYVSVVARLIDGPKYIMTEHNVWNRRRGTWLGSLIDPVIYSAYQKIVACAPAVKRSLVTYLPGLQTKIVEVSNGVPIGTLRSKYLVGQSTQPARSEDVNQPLKILFVGSLTEKKGLDVLIKALAKLGTSPDWICCIAGEGPLGGLLRDLVKSEGLADRVVFLGHRDDVRHLMAAADILVIPSRWEGLPLVLLEAMMVGTPIVASRVGGIADYVEDGTTALLVEPGHEESLREALTKALSSTELRTKLSRMAHAEAVRRFSIESMVDNMVLLYDQLVSNRTSWSGG